MTPAHSLIESRHSLKASIIKVTMRFSRLVSLVVLSMLSRFTIIFIVPISGSSADHTSVPQPLLSSFFKQSIHLFFGSLSLLLQTFSFISNTVPVTRLPTFCICPCPFDRLCYSQIYLGSIMLSILSRFTPVLCIKVNSNL